jgi:hypothetical protein
VTVVACSRVSVYKFLRNDRMNISGLGPDEYGPQWRMRRKLFHQHMNKDAIRTYWGEFEEQARLFIYRVLRKPDSFSDEVAL